MNKTKCIVLGEQPTEVKKKPIEFNYYIDYQGHKKNCNVKPEQYFFIELICLGYGDERTQDLMYAFSNDRNRGCLYIGKWNDGVAE